MYRESGMIVRKADFELSTKLRLENQRSDEIIVYLYVLFPLQILKMAYLGFVFLHLQYGLGFGVRVQDKIWTAYLDYKRKQSESF